MDSNKDKTTLVLVSVFVPEALKRFIFEEFIMKFPLSMMACSCQINTNSSMKMDAVRQPPLIETLLTFGLQE